MENKILVIGAQNIDIFSKSNEDLILEDSNPSKISISYGGVGRNIAVNLNNLNYETHFITVFGDDGLSKLAYNSLNEKGLDISESLILKDSGNSIFLGVMDKENDLHLGFHDMGILEKLDVKFFESKKDFVSAFETIIIDNNLPIKSIEYLLNTFHDKMIIMDAVSTKKAPKLIPFLKKISVLKVNRLELDAITSEKTIDEQLNELHQKGAKTILLTQKDKEVILSTPIDRISQTPPKVKKIINASGAGDAFLSGFVHGIINNLSDEDKIKMANIAARICLGSNESTSENLCLQEIERYAASK